ncbi:MAG: MIP/aquaporin family protein [Brevinema sp.]
MSSEFIAEFLGTTILILLGNGVVSNVLLNKTKGHGSGLIVITAGWAFAVLVAVIITGRISGAHLNPAVTVAMLMQNVITVSTAISYIIAQLLGGIFGGMLVWLFYKDHFDQTEDADLVLACFSTGPAIKNIVLNFFSETVATCVLVLAILSINHIDAGFSNLSTYLVAMAVWSLGLSLGGTTGYAINPARDLGPRIAYSLLPIRHKRDANWSYSWIPVFAPILGGILAVSIFNFI